MILNFLNKIVSGQTLTRQEAAAAMDMIMSGQASAIQIAALVVALKQRGETTDEVAGFVETMRDRSVKIEPDDADAVDGCGTGGDEMGTFNISTAASIVAAAAGVTVAKHGNRSVSSQCGSADILEAAGGDIDPGSEIVLDNINKLGFGFMFAPRFHPAMKYAVEPRCELKMRTVFNLLGPMSNPAGVKRQLVGVYSRQVMPLMAEALAMTGSKHVLVVHSHDGLDEISVCAPTNYIEIKDGNRNVGTWDPLSLGLREFSTDSIAGGDKQANLDILNNVLAGKPSVNFDATAVNAGALIYVSGKVATLTEGIVVARDSLASGAPARKFADWVAASSKSS